MAQIQFIDGTTADTGKITFDPKSYHFAMAGQDVTNSIRFSDKEKYWSNFDGTTDLYRITNEKNGGFGPAPALNESTLAEFGHLLATDPLSAPLAAANKGFNQAFANPFFWKVGAVALLGIAVYAFAKGAAAKAL